MAKKAKAKNDAIITGILVTKCKMSLITVEDLGQMAKDLSKPERASAAKKVLAGISGAGRIEPDQGDQLREQAKVIP